MDDTRAPEWLSDSNGRCPFLFSLAYEFSYMIGGDSFQQKRFLLSLMPIAKAGEREK
jgi:hypothetical protein